MKRILALVLLLSFPLWAMAETAPFEKGVLLTPPVTDISFNYLSNIFGTVDGVLTGSGSQILGNMFGIFNAVLLTFGGITLMYIVIVSTLNTAHQGEIMGKNWSSIWIPLRAATGVALLVPKASGYSLIQILIMWLVVQGIGAADSVWGRVVDYLGKEGGTVIQSKTGLASEGQMNGVISTAGNTYRTLACMYALQRVLETARLTNPALPQVPPLFNTLDFTKTPNKVDIPGEVEGYSGLSGVCGSISWQTLHTSNTVVGGGDARAVAVQQMMADLAPSASSLVYSFPTTAVNPTGPIPKVEPQALVAASFDYQNIVIPILNQANDLRQITQTELQTSMKQNGWIVAGNYFQQIVQARQTTAMETAVPTVDFDISKMLTALGNYNNTLFAKGGANWDWMVQMSQNTLGNAIYAAQGSLTGSASQLASQPQQAWNLEQAVLNAMGLKAVPSWVQIPGLDQVVAGIQAIGAAFGGAGAQSLTNPIADLAAQGSALLMAATATWLALTAVATVVTVILGFVITTTLSNALSVLSMWILPIFMPIIGSFYVSGLVLAIYIPLIPFITFMFAALGWFVGVIEIMIGAPLIAFMLMHPEGHEVWGKAERALTITLGVILRPTLILFGYIAAIIMSYIGIWILNAGFAVALIGILSLMGYGGIITGALALSLGASAAASAGGIAMLVLMGGPGFVVMPYIIGPIMAAAGALGGAALLALLSVLAFVLVIKCALVVLVVQKAFGLVATVPENVMSMFEMMGPKQAMSEGEAEVRGKAEAGAKEMTPAKVDGFRPERASDQSKIERNEK